MILSPSAPSAPVVQAVEPGNDLFAGLNFPEVPTGPLIRQPAASAPVLEENQTTTDVNISENVPFNVQYNIHREEYVKPEVIVAPTFSPTETIQSPAVAKDFSKLYQQQNNVCLTSLIKIRIYANWIIL